MLHQSIQSIIPGVAFNRNFFSTGIKFLAMLTWTFILFYTGTFTIIDEASGTEAARFTISGILGIERVRGDRKITVIETTQK